MSGKRAAGTTISLDAADIEAIAAAVAEKLRPGARCGLVDAQALAERLGVSVDYVYGHADDLGVIRLGDGAKARLRFDVELAEERLRAAASVPVAKRERTRPRRARASNLPDGVVLIPGRSKR